MVGKVLKLRCKPFWVHILLNLNSISRIIVQKAKLFENNVQQLNKMHVPAGSMVKGLIMELKGNTPPTYIKLKDAVNNGHSVSYEFVEGDNGLVFRIANALGFKSVTENKLEVRNG